MFLAAIVAAFWYLRAEEAEREQEALRRDVEYAQQRVRLRLLERQEQLMRIARDLSNQDLGRAEFVVRAEALISQYPELQAITWIDDRRRIRASHAAPTLASSELRIAGEVLKPGDTADTFGLARDLQQPVYAQPAATSGDATPLLQLQVPLNNQGKFSGVVLGEYSIDSLLRYGTPTEVLARYAVTLLDSKNQVLAGTPLGPRNKATQLLPWTPKANEYEIPVSPVGNGLVLRAQAYRTSLGVVGSGLFWLVGTLSAMTAWMLIATWRHTRRRMQAQEALVAETNFRRAMENSMLTGMRAMDLEGRITYVNAAFCGMVGFGEHELIGRLPPFPYWPHDRIEENSRLLQLELAGRSPSGGFEVRVMRKDGTQFDARMYISPLVDPKGVQTGWMTSITNITEAKRIRDQLSASHERFTTVLEGLDAAVSVLSVQQRELLFVNRSYRLWFSADARGHALLAGGAGADVPEPQAEADSDELAGLPSQELTEAGVDPREVYVESLQKWFDVRARYLQWTDGRLAQMLIATDITARLRAEEQAAQQADRAQVTSRLVTMGEMASSVAHELNQPLTAIANYMKGSRRLLKASSPRLGEIDAAIGKAAEQALRAGEIIHRLRDFVARGETDREPESLPKLIEEASALALVGAKEHGVRVRFDLSPDADLVMVDKVQIQQVVLNLIRNAVEAMEDSPRRELEIRTDLTGDGQARVSVSDTGSGLQPDVVDQLFQPFVTTKRTGMGVGLSISRTIIEAHGGQIWAEANPEGGAVFRFTLGLHGEQELSDGD